MSARTQRRPTRARLSGAGWVFVTITAVLLVGALRVQVPLMYLLVGGMMSTLLACWGLSRRMVRDLELRREAPLRVWQDQTVHVGYYLRNRRWGASLCLTLQERTRSQLLAWPAYLACLRSAQVARAGGRFVPRQRGPLALGTVEVTSDFPFALIRARRRLECPADVLVWPRRGRLKVPLLHRGAVEVSGTAPSPVGGGADEFFGLRDYRGGDNPRWIHWRRSAGRPLPVIREMSRPVPELLYILLDTRVDPAEADQLGRLERMIRFTATLVDYAIARNYQVGLALAYPGQPEIVPAASGKGQMHRLLDCLALVPVNPHRRLEQVVARLGANRLRYAQVVVAAADGASLGPRVLRPLQSVCRHLRVVTAATLDGVYEDTPAAADVHTD